MNDQIFISAFGMRVGALDMAAAQAQLVELGAAMFIERKEGAAFESAVAGAKHFRVI